ncbi:G-type lectin S-receptor-like serine/threonine-protein kinase SD2-5 [Phragmites australis]|uniref:G-type lectin S-receptor-like serine/threonine-protein kinase SD2-5 n=1 Tax=Phragmites australis TaxID=29695 RepID=UPI002D795FEB|nr:G-type lectin S-receptor-like serine/threonine-protein kinase SD2-5 [Phragmites australis]XP_062232944.1 G-type lectin S-receptor-like serine/threonine-protein kinase SD2-5 [Phragmites australis]XP_062232945.1 G-type lectin S-receptor-like serine/threonine-protein kinase SD2-5 [Phragmites australis]XP_062232946.1 G-type lectin S-receptor-like serine/threonine-protein kinase SD2-5 [Phragmites australis]
MMVMSKRSWKIANRKGLSFVCMEACGSHHDHPRCTVMLWMLVTASLWIMCSSSIQKQVLLPGFSGSEMDYIDNNGIFLLSNGSVFGFGFVTNSVSDSTSYLLAVVHLATTSIVWSANANSPVSHSDHFVFDKDGSTYLQSGGSTVWTANISGKGATSMQLLDSGNLVVLGKDSSSLLWQSFGYPTDTLLSSQSFVDGMTLVSQSNKQNMTYTLKIKSGDMMLYAGFQTPQPYWSALQDNRMVVNKNGNNIYSANLSSRSWSFYDQSGVLLSQLVIAQQGDVNTTLAAVLGNDGLISFNLLQSKNGKSTLSITVPKDSCDMPAQCKAYSICNSGTGCQCPSALSSYANCDPGIVSPCNSKDSFELAQLESGVGYVGTSFTSPVAKTNLTGCKNACMVNCSCVAVFFDQTSGNCFLYNQIGSLQQKDGRTSDFASFIKVSSSQRGSGQGGSGSGRLTIIVVVIIVGTLAVIGVLVYVGFCIYRRRRHSPSQDEAGSSEDDVFLQTVSGAPIRFTYRELQDATNNFSNKLGQGGFGSVYLGTLPDGSHIAVKKLEGIGQGKKEFRTEVTIIGSIHHIHLVKLRGFCAESSHRLLAYEYMSKGSLDRWIFQNNEDSPLLDWDTRFNIALGTAKGLTYLHEDCESKIIHCDIKPENVLLDENFLAKVSDFGLAKLMTREQSHVFTTLRGTRGYLAPEWITNYAISEKSDVYSYGMVLLEIISGRKSFDPVEGSEKAHLPSYAFKKLEEGDLHDISDAKLKYSDKDDRVEIAIKVALWCIQEDFYQRPSMSKVVQMLEGVCDVPQPPTSSHIGYRLYANAFKSSSEEGTSSGISDYNSGTLLSAVRLSGPR